VEYAGKTVVVVCAHKHIAHADINGAGDTFWSLLKVGGIPNANAPKTWEGTNYDFFLIIDYTQSQPAFTVVPQQYVGAAYAQLPDNP
jgi:hypothetical protein